MSPTLEQRLALRQRPRGPAVMRQRWARILFLHWRVPAESLLPQLPAGLHLDLHEGEAWLGIVPFFMQRVRPVLAPPVPGLSSFLELNVRTYVHDAHGRPGVYFFSLDCDQPLAVEIARSFFHLRYEHATMSARKTIDLIEYEARREGRDSSACFRYGPGGPPAEAAPGSLEFFLAERYLLYSASPDGRLFTGRVHHQPYRLRPAVCDRWSVEPARWNGLEIPHRAPDSALFVDHVDVSIFPLRGWTVPVQSAPGASRAGSTLTS